jgi:hypothetical protein
MKRIATAAATVALLAAMLTPVIAQDRPVTKGSPDLKMGNDGKLPATDAVTGNVPDMGSTTAEPNTATPPRPDATAPKTMGDEGKLPATKSMGAQVPAMKP